MARRNAKVLKLRAYRDKLLASITELEGKVRYYQATLREARKMLQQENYLRVYALLSDDEAEELRNFVSTNEAVKELALVYRMLAVERNYTMELDRAVKSNDWLRAKALSADHIHEQIAHDKMIGEWGKDHGFTRSLREGLYDEDVR